MNGNRAVEEIVFIGDSLTEYGDWAGRFPAYRVANLGRAGERVEELRDRLAEDGAVPGNPALIFLMTGINNIAMEEIDMREPYRDVVRRLRSAYPDAVLIVQSVLPVRLPWVDGSVIPSVNAGLREVAGNEGAEYLDVYGAFVDDAGAPIAAYLLPDGVHVSARGYEAWERVVDQRLRRRAGR